MEHYDDAILSLNAKYGAASMPRTSSQITFTAPGFRTVNQRWSQKLRRLKLAYQDDDDVIAEIQKFWEALEGPTHSGLARDWTDWNTTAGQMQDGNESLITATDQPVRNTATSLYVGDGSTRTFQLIKKYLYGLTAVHYRIIQKPQNGTLVFALNGVAISASVSPSDVTVDYATGIATFRIAPGVGVVPTWGGAFYVPVAFVDDEAMESIVGEGGTVEVAPDLMEVRL